jgi:hypothetical protein
LNGVGRPDTVNTVAAIAKAAMRYVVPALLIVSAAGGMLAFFLTASWEHLLPDPRARPGAVDLAGVAVSNVYRPVDDGTSNSSVPMYRDSTDPMHLVYLEEKLSPSKYVEKEGK